MIRVILVERFTQKERLESICRQAWEQGFTLKHVAPHGEAKPLTALFFEHIKSAEVPIEQRKDSVWTIPPLNIRSE